jgi:hypothetical protein
MRRNQSNNESKSPMKKKRRTNLDFSDLLIESRLGATIPGSDAWENAGVVFGINPTELS